MHKPVCVTCCKVACAGSLRCKSLSDMAQVTSSHCWRQSARPGGSDESSAVMHISFLSTSAATFPQVLQLWQPMHMLATEKLGAGRGLVHMGPQGELGRYSDVVVYSSIISTANEQNERSHRWLPPATSL